MPEIEVELRSTEPRAVAATTETIVGLGGVLFERDGRWFISCLNPGYMAFAVENQGYVKRVIKGDDQ